MISNFFLRHHFSNFDVTAAGLSAKEGTACDPQLQDLMVKKGIQQSQQNFSLEEKTLERFKSENVG